MPAEGGTEVKMWFPVGAKPTHSYLHLNLHSHVDAAGRAGPPHRGSDSALPALDLAGEVRATVSPVSLTTPVLGRLARSLAATARFSFDRFSDVYLVADALGAHAQRAAASDRVSFSLLSSAKRLELAIGPFDAGSGARLLRDANSEQLESPLSLLADELSFEGDEHSETLRVVLRDRDSRAREAGAY
jgi:hypothetical protein